MLQPFRRRFNGEQFSAARYAELKAAAGPRRRGRRSSSGSARRRASFRRRCWKRCLRAGRALTHQLIDNPEYMRRSDAAVPDKVQGAERQSAAELYDGGLWAGADGGWRAEAEAGGVAGVSFDLWLPGCVVAGVSRGVWAGRRAGGAAWGCDRSASTGDLLRQTIVGDHAAENVVLTEVEPETQKTLPDFQCV